MSRYLDRLASFVGRTVSWAFLLGILATGYEVVARYVFNAPTIWGHETTTFLSGAGFLLGGFYAANRRMQISISSVYDLLPAGAQRRLDLANAIISFACFALLSYSCFPPGWRALTRWETTGSAWDPPIPALIMPLLWVGATLLALQALVDLATQIRIAAARS